jgi:hypothetical protein
MQVIGTELGRPFYQSLLAEVKGIDSKEGLELIRSARETAEENQELWFISAIYWLWGNIEENQELPGEQIASKFKEAIEIAAEQKAKAFELRGAIALVKLIESGEQARMARELLREKLQWFGADLEDELLGEARKLLE